MKANIFLYFMGTAGAGKSTMTNAFQTWMFQQGYDAVTVNLDPGAIHLPYDAEVDIRDWVKLEDVMDELSLGPNGAQVASSDLMYSHIEDIKDALDGFQTDYFLIDTPGQIELFAYREPTRNMLQSLSFGPAAAVYLFEPFLSSNPSGMISQMTLASSVKYRLDMSFIQVLNKVDMLDEDVRKRIARWADPDLLYDGLTESEGSMTNELGVELFKVLENTGEGARLIQCSAKTLEGMEDIYSQAQALFLGGEDLDN